MNREPGFYWVKWNNWLIAEYIDNKWQITGWEDDYTDDDWNEIDERRIEREPEKKLPDWAYWGKNTDFA
jgi:hypothetical protein